jgi:hypothetical protein
LSLSVGWLVACAAATPDDVAEDRSLVAARIATVRYSIDPGTGEQVQHVAACPGGGVHCFARVVSVDGRIEPFASPMGYGPADLQSAYAIDPSLGADQTLAIVDAYGYPGLEADLGVYRSQYGLPPCTVANGCLKILNQNGQVTPVAPNAPADDDWTVETALDIDMVSAACPLCNITVVQGSSTQLYTAEIAAAATQPDAISNSWGGPEGAGVITAQTEAAMNHVGIGVFVAAGDSGYDDDGGGPNYPATSAYTISVGGTTLVNTANGWVEKAWQTDPTHAGGSGCSLSVPKPSYQPANTMCSYKATADLSAVGDPSTGMAVYDAGQGGWLKVGGTSAAAPLVTALFAAAGKANVTGAFMYQQANEFYDITAGSNGSCGDILCNAGPGWDGPTGVGTPDQQAIKSGTPVGGTGPTASITSPADQAMVPEGFSVSAMVGGDAVKADLVIDGVLIQTQTSGYVWTAPTLANGSHQVQINAYDAQGQVAGSTITVTVASANGSDAGSNGNNESAVVVGCSAGGSSGGLGALLVLALFAGLRGRRERS